MLYRLIDVLVRSGQKRFDDVKHFGASTRSWKEGIE